jgi:hypothetical protein
VSRPRDTQRSKLYAAEREAWKLRVRKGTFPVELPSWDHELLLEPVTDAKRKEFIASWDRSAEHYRQHDGSWPTGEEAWVKMRLKAEEEYEMVDDFLARIQESRWWQAQGYRLVKRNMLYKGTRWSRGGKGKVHIARGAFNRWIVLHEVAHVLQPADTMWHGREFCAIYLKLVERWIGKAEADALRAAMVKHKVKHRAYSPRPGAAARFAA